MTALYYEWTGEVMRPLKPVLAGLRFTKGLFYALEKGRSEDTHKHHFGWLREAWKNLPHAFDGQFPSPKHLRKAALIQAGYFDETIIDCEAQNVAKQVAAFARGKDDFAHIVVRGTLVVIREAKSQSEKAMGPSDFQASKEAIREIVAHMLGIKPEDLDRNVGKAA